MDNRVSQVVIVVKKSPANEGDIRDAGLIPGLWRSPGGRHTQPTHTWRIPWTKEPGRLQSIASQRVGQDWSNFACPLWIITTYIYTTTKRTSWCCYPVTKWWLTLCNPMECSTPGYHILHYLPEFPQTHVHWVSDAIQPFHPLLPPSPLSLIFPSIGVFSSEPALCISWPNHQFFGAQPSLWSNSHIHTWLLGKP